VAKSKSKSKSGKRQRAGRKPARARLSDAEILAKVKQARKAANDLRRKRSNEAARLVTALEILQMEAFRLGYRSSLKVVFPGNRFQSKWKAPWLVVGRFVWKPDPKFGFGYIELGEVIESWLAARLLDKIGRQRLSRLRVDYVGSRGRKSDYTLAETQPWHVALRKASMECDPDDYSTGRHGHVGSLASRYGIVRNANGTKQSGSEIESLYVWLSSEFGHVFKVTNGKATK
jgi:hypothetical protein